MSDWKVTKPSSGFGESLFWAAMTGGLSLLLSEPGVTKVENTRTGEERRVRAWNNKEAGEKISRGEFLD